MDMKKLFFLVAVATMMYTGCVEDDVYVPPVPEDADIVLNEIMSKDPVTDNDYIELYNKSDNEADISGFLINDAADPAGGFVIPEGTLIPANGFYVVYEPDLTVAVSSGGEDVSLGKADGTLIDYIFCPASLADGTTFGRKTDGGEEWIEGMEATPGAANNSEIATVNGFYGLNIDNSEGEDMVFNVKVLFTDGDATELKFYYVKNYDADAMWFDDDSDPATPDIFDTDTYRIDTEVTTVPSADGSYVFTVPAADLMPGDVISWYMRAKNPAGDKMYYTGGKTADEFDGDIKDDPATWAAEERLGTTIPDGTVNGFTEILVDNTAGGDVTISVKLEYLYGDAEALKFYYVKNYDAATMWFDDDSDPATADVFDTDSYRLDMEIEDAAGDFVVSADGTYTFTIPAADVAAGDVISWYMRAKDPLGDKMYFTEGKTAEEFDGDIKDDPATWAAYSVK